MEESKDHFIVIDLQEQKCQLYALVLTPLKRIFSMLSRIMQLWYFGITAHRVLPKCFCAENNDWYCEEMRNLHVGMSSGIVKKVKKGSNLMIKETNLFSMAVEFKETQCHACFLLQRNGLMEDADFTPYLFTCERKRDEILNYFQRHVKWFANVNNQSAIKIEYACYV